MHPRYLVFITLLALCHLQLAGQALTSALPPEQQSTLSADSAAVETTSSQLPDDPGQEAVPVAEPESAGAAGVPVRWEAQRQTRVGDLWTLSGAVEVHYRATFSRR